MVNINSLQLPEYKCHKVVGGAKIVNINTRTDDVVLTLDVNGDHLDVSMSVEWFRKYSPVVGWYLVKYSDSYVSVSPAGQFEDGYSRMT